MRTNLTSRGMILDIGSMRKFAKQLLGKNKEYEPVLKELLRSNYYYDYDLHCPSLKSIAQKTELSYGKTRRLLQKIYDDLYFRKIL